jgi:mono/diheme cytochrome c family protein
MAGGWPTIGAALAIAVSPLTLAVGAGPATTAGDPKQGAVLWQANACGACHTFARAGSTGTAGPNIDRWLVPHALRAHFSVGLFALSRIYWGGRGMPAFGPDLSTPDVDDLVSFVLDRSFTAPAETVPKAPGFEPPPALVTASAEVVAGWTKAKRLPAAAARGAALFARIGCLSCHTYLGSGHRRVGGRDLSRIGRSGRTAQAFAAYVARPYSSGNTQMPSYIDLRADQLQRLAAFLAASR